MTLEMVFFLILTPYEGFVAAGNWQTFGVLKDKPMTQLIAQVCAQYPQSHVYVPKGKRSYTEVKCKRRGP